jgi:hypothetical protein
LSDTKFVPSGILLPERTTLITTISTKATWMQGIGNDSVSSLSMASINDAEIENATPKALPPRRDVSAWKLMRLNSPEWVWLLMGFIGCAVFGSVMPIFAYFYGEIFAVSANITRKENRFLIGNTFLDFYFDW